MNIDIGGFMVKKLGVLLLILILVIFPACGNGESEEKAIDEFYKQYATEYVVLKEQEDGGAQIQVTAPDFAKIVDSLLQDHKAQEIDSALMQSEIESQPDATKDYIFEVDHIEEEEIGEAFLDQVSQELMVSAITKLELNWEEGSK